LVRILCLINTTLFSLFQQNQNQFSLVVSPNTALEYILKKLEDYYEKVTCFRETGKVIFPLDSTMLAISLHISLQDLQTAAQATKCFRAGHVLSLSSNLLIISQRSSNGRLAHRLFPITRGLLVRIMDKLLDLPLSWIGSLTSKLLLDKLPNPSLTSRTILRNDIFYITLTAP
jgi:hypothetical protein